MAKIEAGIAVTMPPVQAAPIRSQHPTAPSYIRKHACLVRRAIDGKPRFEYNPANAPITLFEMLTPAEQQVVEEFRRDFRMPDGANVADPRELLPDTLPAPARRALERLVEHFPLSTDLEN